VAYYATFDSFVHEIIARYEAGETGASIAQAYGISEQRVNQIVRGKRK
jgi:predicted transcriptional regulator